jgi:hypothetical protein
MTENLLTIIFGCLATLLAVVSIVLACLQIQTHMRRPAHEATKLTPSAIESTYPPVWTAPDNRLMAPRRLNGTKILPMMIFDGLVLAFVSRVQACSVLRLANKISMKVR